jgi:putative endonuclease
MPGPRHVYIGRLLDGKFYVGISRQQPSSLLADHQSGDHSRYTRAKKLIRIEWVEPHPTKSGAGGREMQLKGWSHAKSSP